MKKLTLILAHLVLIIGLITVMPVTKSPNHQVFGYIEIEESVSTGSSDRPPDDSGKKPGSGPKEEDKDESKSVASSIWGWIKKILT